jgi:hypothetical protein
MCLTLYFLFNTDSLNPRAQRALVVVEPGKVTVTDQKAYPIIQPHQIIVKVKAVTLNPVDNLVSLLLPRFRYCISDSSWSR